MGETLFQLTTKQQNHTILDSCKKTSKKIVLIPAGQQSICFYEYLKTHSIDVEFFVDNNCEKQGKSIDSKPIISFEEFKNIAKDKLIIISSNKIFAEQIAKQLRENEIEDFIFSTADYICYSPKEIDSAKELILGKMEVYKKLYTMLEDDLSKETLINRLNYLITYNPIYLQKILRPAKNQYFEPEIYPLTANDSFVDCGAYDGDTLKQLIEYTNGEIPEYFGFEPDSNNFLALQEISKKSDKLKLINKGVWNKKTILRFNSNGTSYSQVDNNGNIKVEVTSIDKALLEEKVTFIKMDIEGSEKEALIGAQNTIIKQTPALAISVYHKFNDLYEIPFLINEFGVDYKYYLRHYAENSSETVLYAIPK